MVDDEPKIRLLLRRCLEGDGYAVMEAGTGSEVRTQLSRHQVDLVTLDLQLGRENGLHIAASIRENSQIPIIMVTGKNDVIDRVVGLELGADDYISKPFHVREVLARVGAVIRRYEATDAANGPKKQEPQIYSFQRWTANPETFELTDPEGRPCNLTSTDFRLLMLFLRAPKRILSRDWIMDELNGQDWTPCDRTVDNQVSRLRRKIEVGLAKQKFIKTVRGVGYIFTGSVRKSGAA